MIKNVVAIFFDTLFHFRVINYFVVRLADGVILFAKSRKGVWMAMELFC